MASRRTTPLATFFAMLDPNAKEEVFRRWVVAIATLTKCEVVAIDGKTHRTQSSESRSRWPRREEARSKEQALARRVARWTPFPGAGGPIMTRFDAIALGPYPTSDRCQPALLRLHFSHR